MNNFFKKLENDFELYIGSIFLCITTIIVIMNVFTRYFLDFTFHWSEEMAVSAFVWTIFLGFANAYKRKELLGVEVLLKILPTRGQTIMEFITSLLLTVISGAMFYFSFKYVAGSTKITAALEISYKYINAAIIICFALTTIYSIYFSIQNFKKIFFNKNDQIKGEDNKC
jgi:TRAP-type C4-dicarboxylate transport system permease small subunit